MHKLLRDFETQTDHLLSARRPDLAIINKKKRTCRIVDFAVPADHREKLKESKKKDKYLGLTWELKKLWNMKVTFIPFVIGAVDTVTEGLEKGLEDLEIRGWIETIQTKALLRSGKIHEKSPGDLRRLITQTPMKNHRLTLVRKTWKGIIIIIIIIIIIRRRRRRRRTKTENWYYATE